MDDEPVVGGVDCPENTPEGKAIMETVNSMWEQYDVDKSGVLEKPEALKFMEATLKKSFTDEEFNEIFASLDMDNSGVLKKDEMCAFTAELIGL